MMMKWVWLLIILCLSACSQEKNTSKGHELTIEEHAFSTPLFYSGTVQPLKTLVVPSVADGIVLDMPFQYGDEVKAGQLLFTISSTKFMTDYKAAFMQYIKAKNEFNNSQTQMQEAEFLHKNQLISDDEYKLKKSNFYSNQLALLQAKDALENLLNQLNIKGIDLYQLSIFDIDKITQAMNLQMNEGKNLQILSPASGVVLSAGKEDGEIKKIAKGDAIKQGDVLAVIGDMSGLSVHIKVNELTVNQLKIGQKVKVTGMAFANETLAGEIKQIDKQAETANNGMPVFSVEVMVPHLTPEQQKEIHVGMSAKVEINIEEKPQIMVPLKAINEKNGAYYVQLYDKKTRMIREAAVTPGKTTVDSVAILSGLKPGEAIVIPD